MLCIRLSTSDIVHAYYVETVCLNTHGFYSKYVGAYIQRFSPLGFWTLTKFLQLQQPKLVVIAFELFHGFLNYYMVVGYIVRVECSKPVLLRNSVCFIASFTQDYILGIYLAKTLYIYGDLFGVAGHVVIVIYFDWHVVLLKSIQRC